MSRLGLTPSDIDDLVKNPPKYLNVELVLSHLACASDQQNPKSLDQYNRDAMKRMLIWEGYCCGPIRD